MAEVLLRVVGLAKSFPVSRGLLRREVSKVCAVDGVSFVLGRGKTLALVGESGCGKTTAGRCIMRLIEPDAGAIRFLEQNLCHLDGEAMRRMRRRMQMVFQDPFSSLNPRRTIGEIIGAPMVLHGVVSRPEVEDAVAALLQQVGLQARYASRYPHAFSGGQRQRIGIARAVALRPDLIICDEAVSALDVSVQAQIINLLLDLKDIYQLSYLFIAHDLAIVRHIADHVAVMYLGRIVEMGTRDDVFVRAAHPYTQALLSAMPQVQPERRKKRVILSGEVPSPIHPPTGCHFHTRCPVAEPRCRQIAPPIVELGEGHSVRCHLYEPTPAQKSS